MTSEGVNDTDISREMNIFLHTEYITLQTRHRGIGDVRIKVAPDAPQPLRVLEEEWVPLRK